MAATFKVPTIFSAIDKVSSVVKGMGNNVHAFAMKAEAGIARSERMFRKLTPSLSGAAKEFLSFASTAAITAAIVGGITFSVSALKDYETGLASLQSITGLTGEKFVPFKAKIMDVAVATKKSSIEVAKAFEIIGSADSSLLESADNMGLVTQAAITLSKASGDTLEGSAQSLVGVMSQFSLAATEADRTINVLAAGAAVGSASIVDTSEAMKNFGSVASGANISIEKSVALVQVLGKFQVKGAEAGTKLRGSILKLQQAGIGYSSGQFNINDALDEANKKISKLSTAKQKDAAILKMFGAENISTGKILLANTKLFDTFTTGVTGTSIAQSQAKTNSDTLTVALEELKAAWVNIITGSNKAGSALSSVKKIIQFVAANLETIVSVGLGVLGFFAAWKVLLIASKVAMIAYNIVYGINNAIQKKSLFFTQGNIVAKNADLVATKAITAAQWLWNAALLANPIGLIIIAIIALIAITVVVIKKYNEWGAALTFLLGPLGIIINLVQSFRRNWDMIGEAFKTGGVLAGFKAIGATILDAILMPLQQVFKLMTNLPGVGDFAKKAVAEIESWRKGLGVNVATDESGKAFGEKEKINPEQLKQENMFNFMERTNNAGVDININDPNGRTTADSNSNLVTIKTSSTMKRP